jgi:hypothetical protein
MYTAFVLGTVFGWWFGPMLTDITKKIWGAIKEWRQFR